MTLSPDCILLASGYWGDLPPPVSIAKSLLVLILWAGAWLLPWFLLSFIAFYLVTLPLRRRERANIFIDLLETSLDQGQQPENVLPEISRTGEKSLGVRFHLFAAHLENGCSLAQALEKVPRFLPPQVTAMLKAGDEIGDLRKVIPACRAVLTDASSQVQGAMNYLVLTAFILGPGMPLMYLFLEIFILPKFRGIADGMGMEFGSFAAGRILNSSHTIAVAQLMLIGVLYLLAALYIGGPRFSGLSRRLFGPLVDALHFAFPWRRNRMRRDFSLMLAILLESNVPEGKAVELASRASANRIFQRRTDSVISDLKNGTALQTALAKMDRSGELQWRMKNAFHGGSFKRSLAGWFEHLDAKSFRQEQTAAHLASTVFLLLNAVLVGLMSAGLFGILIQFISEAALW